MNPRASFHSLLFRPGDTPLAVTAAPSCLHDLTLDALVTAVTAGRKEQGLASLFYAPLRDVDAVLYRQEVMRELENPRARRAAEDYMQRMQYVSRLRRQARQADHRLYAHGLLLAAAETWCAAAAGLCDDLAALAPAARGLTGLRRYLADYTASPAYTALSHDARDVRDRLSAIRYCVRIDGSSVTVLPYDDEPDQDAAVTEVFAKFQAGEAAHPVGELAPTGMNHVEARVLTGVARLYPEPFEVLECFCKRHGEHGDPVLQGIAREFHFYLAGLDYLQPLRDAGLAFSYPGLSSTVKQVDCRDTFDVVLAARLVRGGTAVVTNDIVLQGRERTAVVTGPNGGGKTTFARTFGQVHYLAALGWPVAGTGARLFLCDRVLTHFERVEDIGNLRGKLQDDLVRLRELFAAATVDSVIVLNEVFSSTALSDAIYLSEKVMARISNLEALCVWVTFLDELASFDASTISVVGEAVPGDPAARTYRLRRRPPEGVAYAVALAQRHRVTYDALKERLAP